MGDSSEAPAPFTTDKLNPGERPTRLFFPRRTPRLHHPELNLSFVSSVGAQKGVGNKNPSGASAREGFENEQLEMDLNHSASARKRARIAARDRQSLCAQPRPIEGCYAFHRLSRCTPATIASEVRHMISDRGCVKCAQEKWCRRITVDHPSIVGRMSEERPSHSILADMVISLGAVIAAALQAAALETTSANHTDTDLCGRAFRRARHNPRTVRFPRFTRVSDGKPLRRLEERSKAGLIVGIAIAGHGRLPVRSMGRRD
jgi:hypothetical protein